MRHLTCALILTAVGVFAGCSDQATLDGTTAVTGKVLYNSAPVEGATVTFTPSGEGRAASGRTDAAGQFQLTTLTASDGVLPGAYNVAISKTEVQGALTGEAAQAYFEEHNEPPKVKTTDLLPVKYKNPTASGLTATVSEGGENAFTFELID